MLDENYEITKKEKFSEKHPNLFVGLVGTATLAGAVGVAAGIYWIFGKTIGKSIVQELNMK